MGFKILQADNFASGSYTFQVRMLKLKRQARLGLTLVRAGVSTCQIGRRHGPIGCRQSTSLSGAGLLLR
jgi:hypothetical protein